MNGTIVHPGSVWGVYPERRSSAISRSHTLTMTSRHASDRAFAAVAEQALELTQRLLRRSASDRLVIARQVGAKLACSGFGGQLSAYALAALAAQVKITLGINVYATQLICAAALLEQRMVEMATGEGKTIAAALAAGAGALAGAPVHCLTANEYLAQRDACQMTPVFAALDLTVATAREADSPQQRQSAYQADIVYTTARTIAFDYLRDRLARDGDRSDLEVRVSNIERPHVSPDTALPDIASAVAASADTALADTAAPLLLLRGLSMAIIDEADSILIDEAKMPLIISESVADPVERARIWQALDIARQLKADQHYHGNMETRSIRLTAAGQQLALEIAPQYGAIWINRAHREELIEQTLTGLRLLHRDRDYLIEDGQVVIVDSVTGRTAPGRVWSRGLHAAVALKEGLEPPPQTRTLAQITYPRLFARYHHLCGLSGTLLEVASELRSSYGLATIRVRLNKSSQRRVLAARVFGRRINLFVSAAQRAGQLLNLGRPVLMTVDSVVDSRLLAAILRQRALPHRLLNASNASQEAAIVALAGQQVGVTVATQMAGRGTDIHLSEAVIAAGGLHVLNLQHNRSRRLDRQIAGRAGRQGQPGSYEHWVCLETELMAASALANGYRRIAASLKARNRLAYRIVAHAQRCAEREDAALRKATSRQDKDWADSLAFTTMVE